MRGMLWVLVAMVVGTAAAAQAPPAPPIPPANSQERIDALAAEVAQLKAEIETLRAENASLKDKLTAAEKAGTRPTTRPLVDLPATPFELGPEAKLGAYTYRAPLEWVATPVKDNKNGMLYRTNDKVAAILIQIRNKGAAPPEMQHEFAQKVIQMLKADFVKGKTEVVEPPAAQPDRRFYCKVHERIRLPDEKTADQTHYYLVNGKDMIEATVISKAIASDQVAAAQRLAEGVVLSFAPGK